MKIVLIGGPGAGKGTQARILSKHFNIVHVSTGELLREQMARQTDLGKQVEDAMTKGDLVPDEAVTGLLKERVSKPDCANGFIIDGYPRNLKQADLLANDIAPDLKAVVYIKADDEFIIARMSGRKSCEKCGQMYHTQNNPPRVKDVCDVCGGALKQREDDKKSTVRNRLNIYHKLTEPIIAYYEEKQLLLTVDGVGNIDGITAFIIDALESRG